MAKIPSKGAFFATLATVAWTQALTLVTGALTARLLGPEGRGLFAGAQVWPGIIGMVSLLGFNNAFSLCAANERRYKGTFERQALWLGMILSTVWGVAGWFAMAWLVPRDNPDLLWLSRLSLLNVPVFVLTSNLMAIDQGAGDLRQFNIARNILTPVYLVLLLAATALSLHKVSWFILALIFANLAVLGYRLAVVEWRQPRGPHIALPDLAKKGLPFWITGIAAVFRDNAERLLLLFLLGPTALGFFVVASTASGMHLNISRSLNVITFSRAANLQGRHALLDAARLFRLLGVLNLLVSLGMLAAMPLLIWVVYGSAFSDSIVPGLLLLAAQYFLSQGAILDEALRAKANPLAGLGGMLVAMACFALAGLLLARPFGLAGVACASIIGQAAYCGWMILRFRRAAHEARLVPSWSDVRELRRIASDSWTSVRTRLAPNPAG